MSVNQTVDKKPDETKAIVEWKNTIGEKPIQIIANDHPLVEAWSNMGIAYGKIQLEKQKYRRAGMTAAVETIDKKLEEERNALEERTIDLLGYPRLDRNLKSRLESLARADNLHLNTYDLTEYTKLPPPNIAQAIMQAKQYFDRLEIWAIEQEKYVRPMKDPAVIGYVKIGYYEVPYLVATWGDDIRPEDLGVNVNSNN